MTSLEIRPTFDSTSAAGAMVMRQVREPVLVGLMLAGLGTSSAHALPVAMVMRSPRPVEQTTAGASVLVADRAGPGIAELRRVSGFTWDQLSRLFNVSRRSLHFWASGKAMTPSNEEHLQRLLAVVRKIDRGSAGANRTALLTVREDGTIPFDLLAAEHYEQVVALLGPGEARRVQTPKLPVQAMAARAPRPPEELVGALQDRIHPASGRLLAAKAVRAPRGK
jgi:DNA-binding transcriptional regulator YiaG